MVRELYLTDLVQLSFLPSAAPELRNLAEELILARLPQLPPAQKLTLARRGPPRIAGALLADGQPEVVPVVLDSPFLNEGHVLKALSRVALSGRVVAAIADHQRWSHLYSVQLALLRNSQTPPSLGFFPFYRAFQSRICVCCPNLPRLLRTYGLISDANSPPACSTAPYLRRGSYIFRNTPSTRALARKKRTANAELILLLPTVPRMAHYTVVQRASKGF